MPRNKNENLKTGKKCFDQSGLDGNEKNFRKKHKIKTIFEFKNYNLAID
jgi:hypothetical protein